MCFFLRLVFCTMLKEQRTAVIEMFKTGKNAPAIAKILGVSRQTAHNAIKRYQELGTTEDRPRSGRPVTATTPENCNKVKCRVWRNSEQSMRKMAQSIGISKDSVRRIVTKQLRLRCYKPGTGHFLDDRMKRVRLENARRLLKIENFRSVLFTDEKIFTVERPINRQNNRQLLRNQSGETQNFLGFLMARLV